MEEIVTVMGLVDYMGAFTDSSRRMTPSKGRSRIRSSLSDFEGQGQGSCKRPRTIEHKGFGLGLGSVVHLSAGDRDSRSCLSDCENNSVVRRLNLLPAPSPFKRLVQGPQRPNMPKRSPSTKKSETQFTPVRSMNMTIVAEELEPQPELELELDEEWSRPVRCYQSSTNFKALESYKIRVANLQKAFAYAQHGRYQREPHRQGRERENGPSSSSDLTVLVDVDERKKERKAMTKSKEKPLYKTLYESTRERDFKLKALELEIDLATKKFEALQFTTKEIKSESQIQNQNEAEREQLGEDNELVALHDVFTPLSDDEESDVAHALKNMNRSEVLVMHDSSNIQITREMMRCLLPTAWLNDEVINLYLELLKEREKREPKKYLKCHFFNTFFYKKLYSPKYDYKAVRRWTTQKKIGYSLIDCEKIFVPIHKEIHWCLAIIDLRAKKFQYLDSLRGTDGHVLQILARYIADEAKDKTGQHLDVSTWEQEVVEDIPEQENGWDCGMFMIKYADFHSRDLPLIFGQEHMPYFRKRTAKEILRLRAE